MTVKARIVATLGRTSLLALVASLFLAVSASAATVETHPFLQSLVPPATATPKGPFRPIAVAVNQSTGNIYVVDMENAVIDVFRSNGSFLDVIDGSDTPEGHFDFSECCGSSFSPIAIDNSGGPTQGRIYVKNHEAGGSSDSPQQALFALSPVGSYLSSRAFYTHAVGLAFDSNGSLFISGDVRGGNERSIGVYSDPESELPSAVIQVPFGEISLASIALDSQDNIYVTSYTASRLAAINADGSLRWTAATSGTDNAVAVDRSTDEVYAVEGVGTPYIAGDPGTSYVSRYDTNGKWIESFGASVLSAEPRDIAVNEASGKLYVADKSKGVVQVFGAKDPTVVPDAVAEGTTGVADAAATLQGMVNPQGVPASWRFQYRRQKSRRWTSTGLSSVGSGASNVAVSSEVTGLVQNTTYEVRLQAINSENGAINTSNTTVFTTSGLAQAIVSIDSASGLSTTTAHLSGAVDPNGSDAKWHFEYATDNTFDENWSRAGADQVISAGAGLTSVGADISGLSPNTHYFGRLIAANETGGPKASNEIEFTTAPAKPVVFALAAGCLKVTSACLGGYVDPRHSSTSYYFEYGLDESYGSSVPASQNGDAGSALGASRVAERISDLQPDEIYHFRLVAVNQAGPTYGPDMQFKTRPDATAVARLEASWPARGYEMVNSPDKGNQAVLPVSHYEPWTSISPDGGRVLWRTQLGGPESPTGSEGTFVSTYTPNGWTSRSTLPPASQLPGAGDDWYYSPSSSTPDFSFGTYFSSRGLLYGKYQRYLIRVDSLQHVTPLALREGDIDPQAAVDNTATASDGRVVIGGGSVLPLGEFPLTLYEADGSAVSVPVPACGYSQIQQIEDHVKSWVNADASRIFVYSSGAGDCSAPKGIYMLEPASGGMTLVSGIQNAPSRFIRANSAGTELLFAKGGDLYQWSDGGGEKCLSCNSGFEIEEGIASADLSHFYFCGPLPDASPSSVDCAIYVWRAAGIRFVADKSEIKGVGDDPADPIFVQTSANGEQIIFKTTRPYMASADPTGWNGIDSSNGGGGGAAATQLYRYDDTSGTVECVSCTDPPSGGLATPELGIASNQPTLSADGQTIAFSTTAKLLPEDINGRIDVYEWHDGLIRLVTDGESEFQKSIGATPRVWGLSGDGHSLFFSEGGVPITGNEMDSYGNVYDARIGSSGFPPAPPAAHCAEDSCQGPLQASPGLAGASSATFAGPRNAAGSQRHGKKRKKKRSHKRGRARQGDHKRAKKGRRTWVEANYDHGTSK